MMYEAGQAYLKLDQLLRLLAQCPSDATIWINPVGNLSVVDPDGKYLGYIDCAWNEKIIWHDQPLSDRPAG